MKKIIICLAIVMFSIYGFNIDPVYPETETSYDKSKTTGEEPAEPSKGEMLLRLENIFGNHPDMLPSMGVTTVKNKDGIASYVYNGVPLDSLDKDTLFVLLQNVDSQVSWKDFTTGSSDTSEYEHGSF